MALLRNVFLYSKHFKGSLCSRTFDLYWLSGRTTPPTAYLLNATNGVPSTTDTQTK